MISFALWLVVIFGWFVCLLIPYLAHGYYNAAADFTCVINIACHIALYRTAQAPLTLSTLLDSTRSIEKSVNCA